MQLRRLAPALAFALAGIVSGLHAQVKATLVAADATVQPGHPFHVALHLIHQSEWHTYWLNPGTGLATTLEWHLPAGWKAGDIEWPAPEILKDPSGNVIGNGYDGDTLLPVTLNPPADLKPGTSVELKASASWLMCRDVCKPGSADVAVSLPVSAEAPAADPLWGPRIQAVVSHLPRADARWVATATRGPKSITLTVDPAGGASSPGEISPATVHFFGDDDIVAFDQPQSIAADGRGGFTLTAPLAVDAPANPARLTGDLTCKAGWSADGTLPALRIDVAFGAAAPASAATTAAPASPAPPSGGSPAAVAGDAGGSLAGTLVLAVIGGLILNLMPCVFPVLGIKILGFVNQAGHERRKVVAHGLAFSLGVLLSFWALAGALAILRAGGAGLGWGFQLQSPAFVFGLAAIMLVFALNMSGVFEFGLAATGIGSNLQTKSGLAGSFFSGMLATVVATPCSAPFLAPALGAALALSTADSFLIFTAIAIGLALPYLLLSLFPGAVKILPRPGAWMVTFRQLLAFPLYGTVGYLVWVLAGQVAESDLLTVLFGLVLIALGAWIYGRWNNPESSARAGRIALVAGFAVALAGVWTAWPRPPAPTAVVWDKWSPEAVAALRAEHRIVYVDFTARWCATCQANKKLVFHSDDVLRTFREKGVATLRADWTNRDPAITAELARFHRSAVPFNLVWLPDREDPVILPSLLTPGIVLDAVKGRPRS